MVQKIKILHVIHVPFAIPYFLGDQLSYFKDTYDAEIHIACSSSESLIKLSKKWGFTPMELNISRKISPVKDIISIIKLIFYIKKNNFNVVVSHSPKGALIGTIAAFICGVENNIYVRHGLFYETSTGFRLKIFLNLEKTISYFSAKVICVSKSILDKSVADKITNPKKMLMINKGSFNGIDSMIKFNPSNYSDNLVKLLKKKYNISNNEIVIGFVGRLSKDKGVQELYEAWEILKQKYDSIKLILIGPIDERDKIENFLVEKFKFDNTVILTGLIENTAPLYRLMDIFILPSFREGFPTVVLEASAMELPVITTKKTGCVDSILENETGMFIDIIPEEISNIISRYIEDPLLRTTHGQNGRRFVKQNYDQTILWEFLKKNVYS